MGNIVTKLKSPVFLMNPPFSISGDVPNNIWMKELTDPVINKNKALNQFMELYNYVASDALTYLLPSKMGLQDQTYVANLGIVLPHTPKKTVVLANFRSEPRRGEEIIGQRLFELMEMNIVNAPKYFEGEADLKFIKNNVYIGGHGIRTSINCLDWFERSFDMKVIKLLMEDEYLYHLDCLCFPLSVNCVMLCTEMVDDATLKEIEQHVNIIDVSADHAYCGITNCVRLGKQILCASNLNDMKITDEYYNDEKTKVETFTKICSKEGFEPVFFNLSEFYKSGAMLSCMMMHLNYADYIMPNV